MSVLSRGFVSLFSGAGGLDAGLERAGWLPLAQVEMDEDAAATLELAARRRSKDPEAVETRVYQAPIELVDPDSLRRSLGLRRGQLALLAGGPPCQPFTTHGLRQSIHDERASSVWPTYLQYVDAFRPKALLIENVDGLLSAAIDHRPLNARGKEAPPMTEDEMKGSFLRWLLTELASRGYATSWGVAEAADYGAPQMRQRSLIIGVRGRNPIFLPAATHGGPGQPPFLTLRDALKNVRELGPVQPLSARKRAVYELIPPGGNWRDLPVELQAQTMGKAHLAEGGKSGWWRRLAWDAPAPTILGMPDHSSTALIHPTEVRCLSVNECAALQTFAAETEFAGSPRSQYQQIGNAVPVVLAEAVGRQLAAELRTTGSRLRIPDEPRWRQSSSNRRVGTHGWVLPSSSGEPTFSLRVKVRPDHIWAAAGVGTVVTI